MKLALVGYGVWGELILRDLLELGVAVDVVEVNASRRQLALDAGADGSLASIDTIEGVDGIIIATPATTHAAVILQLDACKNTVPIFCEKPLAGSTADARILTERAGPPIYVMHIWRYHAGIRKLKEVYESGAIGELTMIRTVRANWTSSRTDVDALKNLAPHDLSIFQFIIGDLPSVVCATSERIDGKVVGCIGVLKNNSGPVCIFEVSNRYGEKRREVRLHGTKGVLVLPHDRGASIQYIRGAGTILPEMVEAIRFEPVSALKTEFIAFLEYLKTGDASHLCSVEDGAAVVIELDNIFRFT